MKKKKSFKVLVLSILTIMCTVLAVPGFASADAADGEAAADYFPTVNHDSYDFPIVLNVDAKGVGTGDTGFMTMDTDQEKVSAVSIVLPIIICLTASAVAYIVLRQIKTFKQKNSDSLELLTESTSRFLSMIKNPSLLLAICFGLGCAAPVFFLQANISKADAHEITDIDYDSTDFSTYNGRNPYGIKIDVGYNDLLNSSRTDEEMIADAAEEEAGIEPKFERKIEEDGEFVVGSVDATFTTFNYNGFFADYGMKSGVVCAEETDAGIQECREKTNLVNGDNKIPSITEKMTKAEFEKLKTAAWGWSDDGKDYYPLFWPSVREDPIMDEKNQTIYFAVKLTNSVAPGTYQSSDNFQVYAENNKLTNDMFSQASIAYRNGEQIVQPAENQWPLFLRTRPGQLAITETVPGNNGECKKFIGWSEKSQTEYDTASDKTSIKLYRAGERFVVSPEMMGTSASNIITVTTLNAIWEETAEGCKTYAVEFDQSFLFAEVYLKNETICDPDSDDECEESEDHEESEGDYEIDEKIYCAYSSEHNGDCDTTYRDSKLISALYIKHINNIEEKTVSESYSFSLDAPVLKGYDFKGWQYCSSTTDGECASGGYYEYDSESGKFKHGDEIIDTVTLEAKGDATRNNFKLTAVWQLRKPILNIEFYNTDATEPIYTYSSENYTETHGGKGKWYPSEEVFGENIPNGISTMFDFEELPASHRWDHNKRIVHATIDDLENATEANGNRPEGTAKYYELDD